MLTLGGCKSHASPAPGNALPGVKKGPYGTSEPQTPYADITTYNNFYEFGTDKSDPGKNAGSLRTRPWAVAFDGEIKKPQTLDIDALLKLFPLEERIYRLRCVEGWSMGSPGSGSRRRAHQATESRPAAPSTSPSPPCGPRSDAGPEGERARLALRRGLAHRTRRSTR